MGQVAPAAGARASSGHRPHPPPGELARSRLQWHWNTGPLHWCRALCHRVTRSGARVGCGLTGCGDSVARGLQHLWCAPSTGREESESMSIRAEWYDEAVAALERSPSLRAMEAELPEGLDPAGLSMTAVLREWNRRVAATGETPPTPVHIGGPLEALVRIRAERRGEGRRLG